jgi:hypothetical protein
MFSIKQGVAILVTLLGDYTDQRVNYPFHYKMDT